MSGPDVRSWTEGQRRAAGAPGAFEPAPSPPAGAPPEGPEPPKRGAGQLPARPAAVAALAVIAAIVLLAVVGPGLTGYGYNDQNPQRANLPPRVPGLEALGILDGSRWLQNRRADGLSDPGRYPPGSVLETRNPQEVQGVQLVDVKVNYYRLVGAEEAHHWLGTDYLGRDLLTRLLRGARVSLLIALVAVGSGLAIGVLYGAVAGYCGGRADFIMMRFAEVVSALPQLVMITLFIMVFGTGLTSIILALVVRGWVPTARLVRGQVYRYKQREYVLAARTMGAGGRRLIWRHILPAALGPVATRAALAVPGAIFSEAFLAYIGLGIQAPEPSIGVLLSDGQRVLLQYPYQVLFPALLISALMLAFNLLAGALQDALDPHGDGGG